MAPRSKSSAAAPGSSAKDNGGDAPCSPSPEKLLSSIVFRTVTPMDISQCLELERASYPPDEAASKNSLQYRQHHAAPFFRCAVRMKHVEEEEEVEYESYAEALQEGKPAAATGAAVAAEVSQNDVASSPSSLSVEGNGDTGDSEINQQQLQEGEGQQQQQEYYVEEEQEECEIVGFICSTRCQELTNEAMLVHVHDGPLLAIHSVVVKEEYRRKGLASAMLLDYVEAIRRGNVTEYNTPIKKIVLLAKQHLLSFYVDCGFSVISVSTIVHGKERWYDLELDLTRRPKNSSKHNRKRSLLAPVGGEDVTEEGGKPCFMVDSFATSLTKPGTGNPAAVVLLPKTTLYDEGMEAWCQTIAAEFNLAETAFCWPAPPSSNKGDEQQYQEVHWNIRYFTPKVEIPLCGHATLASAAVLYSEEHDMIPEPKNTKIVFHAKEDVLVMEYAHKQPGPDAVAAVATAPLQPLSLSRGNTANNGLSSSSSSLTGLNSPSLTSPVIPPIRISMEFPSKPVTELTTRDELSAVNKMLESAFAPCKLDGVLFIGRTDLGDVLVELTPKNFHDIGYECLNYKALLEWDGYYRGVIVCCRGSHISNNTDAQRPWPLSPIHRSVSRTSSGSSSVEAAAAAAAAAGASVISSTESFDKEQKGEATSDAVNETIDGSLPPSPPANGTQNTASFSSPDFLSRFFGPKTGVNEDPVTGSAHCVLGPYFAKKLNKTVLIGKQESERGGIVECEVVEDKVILTGSALITMSGTVWV